MKFSSKGISVMRSNTNMYISQQSKAVVSELIIESTDQQSLGMETSAAEQRLREGFVNEYFWIFSFG
jgi:hypothetical protein